MIEAGAEVVETDTFQASRIKLDEGVSPTTPGNQRRRPRSPARQPARTASSPARSGRPGTCPPRMTRRSGRSASPSWSPIFEQAGGLVQGGADLIIIETAQDILEVKAAIFGPAPPSRRPAAGPDPGFRLASAQRRQDAARHRHRGGADHARGPEGRRDRPQLLDRSRGHAGRDPLPRRELGGSGPLHPERRPADPGPRRRDDLPEKSGTAGRGAGRVRRALRVERVGGCCGTTPEHIRRDRRAGQGRTAARERPAPRPQGFLDDDPPRWSRNRPRPWSASGQLAGVRARRKSCCRRRLATDCVQIAEDQVEGGATCSTSASR